MLEGLGVGSIKKNDVKANRDMGDATNDEMDKQGKGECGTGGGTDGSGQVASCRSWSDVTPQEGEEGDGRREDSMGSEIEKIR